MPKPDAIIETPVVAPSSALGGGAKRQKIKSRGAREYVAGGQRQHMMPYPEALPPDIDELTRDFGDDLYDRMMHDPCVLSCVETLKRAVLAQGLTLTPAVGKDDPRYDDACEIRDFCQRSLDGLAEPVLRTMYDLLDAIAFGNRVAEIVYREDENGAYVHDRLKVKPRRVVSLCVDAYSNLIGVLGLEPGKWQTAFRGQILLPNQIDNLLPRAKFVVFTYRKKAGDPRGQSILRAAYTPWQMKRQLYPEMMRYAAQFGTPSLIAKVPADADDAEAFDPVTGQTKRDGDGNLIRVTAKENLAAQLQAFRNGSFIVVDVETEIDPLEIKDGAGTPFQGSMDAFNREIVTSILLQTLTTTEGEHMARAASQTHQDVFGLLVQGVKGDAEACIRYEILAPLIRLNKWGEDGLALLPFASLTETEQQDFASDAGAIGSLWQSGFLDPSQLPELDARLGIPKRSDEELAARTQKALAPPAPQPGSGSGEESQPSDDSAPFAAAFALFDLPGGWTAPDEVASGFALFADDDGHWVHINGHNVFIKGGGAVPSKSDVHQAVQAHVAGKDAPSYANIVWKINKAIADGKIKDEKDLYHALVLAHGVNTLAVQSGKAKAGASIGNSAFDALMKGGHFTLDQLQDAAAGHPDPKLQAKAQALLAEVQQHFHDTDPDAAKSTAPDAQTGANAASQKASVSGEWDKKHSGNYALEHDGKSGQVIHLPDGKFLSMAHGGGDGRAHIETHTSKEQAFHAVEKAVGKVQVPDGWDLASKDTAPYYSKPVAGGGESFVNSNINGKWQAGVYDKDDNAVLASTEYASAQEAFDAADKAIGDHAEEVKQAEEAQKAHEAEAQKANDAAKQHGFADPGFANGHSQYTASSPTSGANAIVGKDADGKWNSLVNTPEGSATTQHADPADAMQAAKTALDDHEAAHVQTQNEDAFKQFGFNTATPGSGVFTKQNGNGASAIVSQQPSGFHAYVDDPDGNVLHSGTHAVAADAISAAQSALDGHTAKATAQGVTAAPTQDVPTEVYKHNGTEFEKAPNAEMVHLKSAPAGYSFAVNQNNDGTWAVIETQSGLAAGSGAATKEEAIKKADAAIAKAGDKFPQIVQKGIDFHGLSPAHGGDGSKGVNYPNVGDKVSQQTAGPFGTPGVMQGEVVMHPKKKVPMVKVTGAAGLIGGSTAYKKAKYVDVDNSWQKQGHSVNPPTMYPPTGSGFPAPAASTATSSATAKNGGDFVSIGGKKVALTGDAATPQMVDDAGTEHGLTEKAKEKFKNFIASGAIKTHSDLHQKIALAHAAGKAAGQAGVGGTSINLTAGYSGVRDLMDKADKGDSFAQSVVPHLGATNLKTGAQKNQAAKQALGTLSASDILHKQVGGQGGSNAGGVYETPSGQKHYVKQYSDPDQAHGEAVANAVYNALGISAPQSKAFTDANGVTHHAAQMVDKTGDLGAVGLTKAHADEVLKGFAADVLLGNWDAYGASGDNMSLGKDGNIYRIDNGGSLLHRAQGQKKDQADLDNIHEWRRFASPKFQYGKIFQAAGVKGADDIAGVTGQISAIENLKAKYGGWDKFIAQEAPGTPPALQKQLADVLEKRTALLSQKKQDLLGPYESALSQYTPHQTHQEGANWVNQHYAAQAKQATPAESKAADWWKGGTWKATNQHLYKGGAVSQLGQAEQDHIHALDGLFAKPESAAPENVVLLRGFGLNQAHEAALKAQYEAAQPGHIFKVDGYTAGSFGQSENSSSGYASSSGFKWHINVPKGHPLVHVDGVIGKAAGQADPHGEREMLLNRGSVFRLLKTEKDAQGVTHHYVEMIPDPSKTP